MTPLVSVITPAWNAALTLDATIASVAAQSLPDWEMLIADDGSTDATPAIAAAWAARDPRVRPLPGPGHAGPAAARNRAIRAARGRFLAFLDADDRWRPEKLARQLAFMEAAGSPFSFTAYAREDATGRALGIVRAPARVDYAGLLRGNVIGCLTAVYDTSHFGKVEMPPLPLRQDYALWLALLRGGEARGLDEVLADYRVGGAATLSGSKLRAARGTWAVLRREGLPLPRTLWCFAHYATAGLRRRAQDREGARG
ncbi:glycosyltransferase family 2 protein [Amaricoccus sp.]|uniref:glycosyltransferase family 2 protein n=1 Tax=Amaricoccus sp. TaxID=1872485 RepID=UPI002632B1CE|nr:glycosyltransferase family 2 protein [Amaricoccus sp.]HRO12498.1 glycosyltransferase family 2 protein [Amaricoccus sp.]